MTLTIRPSHCAPQHIDGADSVSIENRRVLFKHPSYPQGSNVLLTLEAPDGARDGRGGGLHHDTARIACAIVAGNCWDGFLSHNANGSSIDLDPDDVLYESEYFFIVPKDDMPADAPPYQYPVVPNFRHWRFPQELPKSWQELGLSGTSEAEEPDTSNTSIALHDRDGSCRLSAHRMGVDRAHICPQSEVEWFTSNSMWRYVRNLRKTGPEAIDDTNNMLLLRADLHRGYDNGDFAFVPKKRRLVAHALQPHRETRSLYHNIEVLRLLVPTPFLLARWAYTLFPLIEGFLGSGTGDKLLLLAGSREPSQVSVTDCWQYGRRAARSQPSSPRKRSPTKRARPDTEEQDSYQAAKRNKTRRLDAPSSIRSEYTEELMYDDFHILCEEQSSVTTSTPILVHAREKKSNTVSPELNVLDSSSDDDTRLQSLRNKCLQLERIRSDPDGHWKSEQEWLRGSRNRFNGPDEIKRMWLAEGLEIRDD